jgi:hypothetical protein
MIPVLVYLKMLQFRHCFPLQIHFEILFPCRSNSVLYSLGMLFSYASAAPLSCGSREVYLRPPHLQTCPIQCDFREGFSAGMVFLQGLDIIKAI